MSLYQNKLKKEIFAYQESIERLNKNIILLKEDLVLNKNVYTKKTHKNMIFELTFLRDTIKSKLEKIKRLVH